MKSNSKMRTISRTGLTSGCVLGLVTFLGACSSSSEATKYYAPQPGSSVQMTSEGTQNSATDVGSNTDTTMTTTSAAQPGAPESMPSMVTETETETEAETVTTPTETETDPTEMVATPTETETEPTETVTTPTETETEMPVEEETGAEEPVIDLNPPAPETFDLTLAVMGLSATIDTDSDGAADGIELDTDGDGTPDAVAIDTNGDAFPDALVRDTDGDGTYESEVDMPEPSPPPVLEAQPCNFELSLLTTGSSMSFGRNWAPNNYGALWVSDDAGGFIRTFEVWGGRHINDLREWNSQTSANRVDAVSGATMSSHQTHTINWDCTDLDGELLPSGSYILHAEVTEGGQGPYMEIPFEIGAASADLTPAAQDGFTSITLSYAPTAQ